MDRYKQQKISSEIRIPLFKNEESDHDYACRFIDETTDFLKKYALQVGKKGFVCNLSGGVDSFVTSMLIKKAGLFLINLSLPFSDKKDMGDVLLAKEVVKPDVFKVYDITKTVDDCLELLKELPDSKVSIGNTKARVRMTILYRVAEVYDILVAGSINAAELTLGMVTKYGDSAADVHPIAGATKRIVYEMAKIFEAPSSIIDKVSTAGLWDNGSNQEDVTELNHQVCLYLRGKSISEEYENRVVKLYENSRHKRHLSVRKQDAWWKK
ncbi:MAG TPA: NAD(+) synthase [Clostridiaceae bacterium]